MPADVGMDVDQARHDGQSREIVSRVRRVSGLDRRDFGSADDDGRVSDRLAGPVDDGPGVDSNCLGL